ncbi:MAG: methyltransferase family protein [Methyloceanibacter sp.]|uniref:methyltransferase family protein n=1 Tax=Methyloceanibacter sp. TaxID=1965321 RepID=UPI003D9BCA6C
MSNEDHANVAIKPPLLFLAALGLGCLLSLAVPIGPALASPNGATLAAGLGLIVGGLVLAVLSAQRFQRAGTSVVPDWPATALVTTGLYARSRNPIYVGLILVYVGLSIALTSVWALLLLVPVLLILQQGVVLREEAYLERKFGEAYAAYKARVPRWL